MTGRRRTLVLALAAVVALAVGPAAAGLHSNHLTVDAQVSEDGTVVIENGFAASEALIVVHADAGGEPGEAVAVAEFPHPGEFVAPITVSLPDSVWSDQSGARTYWAVLHNDADNDGEYDPGSDNALTNFGSVAGDRFVLSKGDAPAHVVAQGFGAQESPDGSVTIPRVALPEDGHLVVRAHGEDGAGEVVASKPLASGVHEDVTVSLDPSFFDGQGDRFAVHAQVHTGEVGSPVTAGDSVVGTKFFISKPEGASAAPDGSAGGNDSNGSDGNATNAPDVNTPDDSDEPQVNTPTETSSSTATESGTGSGEGGATDPATTGSGGTNADGPGFGLPVALVALVGGTVALARRN
ncbi:DUF7282 domain-containing protein [Halomarina litorea]|uniref:DUF7282 domain-containing protein n=1 Tax=Halomarina litorea TaxID=2961595 RepID=UPI0020C34844|nr:PGF-CTERM sorting domain-containing protein [Halomarina sp. BCD28]